MSIGRRVLQKKALIILAVILSSLVTLRFAGAIESTDTTPPTNPSISSSEPAPNVWTKDNTIDISWIGGTDALSGVAGYSFSWTQDTTAIPDTTVDTASIDFGKTTIAATGAYHTVGLRSDGTVTAVGNNGSGQTNVSTWRDIVAVAAGMYHTVGLKADGTVTAVGNNTYGQTNVSTWRDIVAVAAGMYHTVGLKADGTVVAVGSNGYGQTNTSSWTDIIAVNAAGLNTVGLKADGTVTAVGDNSSGQRNVSSWTEMTAVAAGLNHTVGLKSDGTVLAVGDNYSGQRNVSSWTDIAAVAAGGHHTVGLKADGTVVAAGNNTYGQTNVSSWRNIVAVTAGIYHTVGLKADGTVVAVGNNNYGQRNVSAWTEIRQLTYRTTSPPLADGTWYFNVRAKDFAGNFSSAVHFGPFLIDRTPPESEIGTSPGAADGTDGWFKTAPTVTVSKNEPGIAYYSWDSSTSGWTVYTDSFNSPEGEHTLYYYSADRAGNTEKIKSRSIHADTGNPAEPALSGQAAGSSEIDLSWTASDDGVSGVAGYRIYDADSDSRLTSVTGTSHSFTGLAPSTTYRYYVRAFDAAGNLSAASNTVALTTLPTTETTSTSPSGETLAGGGVEAVTVSPTPDVSLTFSDVTADGTTTVIQSSNPVAGAPSGFKFRRTRLDIATTAGYTGPILVAIRYDEADVPGNEASLKLFHGERGRWKDVTLYVDTVNNIIFGQVNRLCSYPGGQPMYLPPSR